jgi:hypothetical protein
MSQVIGARRELEPDDLIWLSTSPQGGLPGLFFWSHFAPHRPSLQRNQWQGSMQFFDLGEPFGHADKLILYRFDRLRTELPFEFHDLPLP